MPYEKTCKIYKIVSPNTDKIYIGSTCLSLTARMNRHRFNKKCSSYKIVECGGAYIEVLERFIMDENNKEAIKIREQFYIDSNIEIVINKNKAYNRFENQKERNKYYRSKNKANVVSII